LVETPERLTPAAAEWVGLGRIYQKAECQAEALAAWERAVSGEDGELEPDTATRVWREIGLYYKRDANWSRALEIWQTWAAQLPWDIEPFVECAKYYEWKARDCAAALAETERALHRAQAYPKGRQRLRWLTALQHRRERLLGKINPA
jgi:tetratricopeptide (TPR) repeat protein